MIHYILYVIYHTLYIVFKNVVLRTPALYCTIWTYIIYTVIMTDGRAGLPLFLYLHT